MSLSRFELLKEFNELDLIKERFISWLPEDHYLDSDGHLNIASYALEPDIDSLWLPFVYDNEFPERCLVGMISGNFSISIIGGSFNISTNDGIIIECEEYLDIALIKIILEQQNRLQIKGEKL